MVLVEWCVDVDYRRRMSSFVALTLRFEVRKKPVSEVIGRGACLDIHWRSEDAHAEIVPARTDIDEEGVLVMGKSPISI